MNSRFSVGVHRGSEDVGPVGRHLSAEIISSLAAQARHFDPLACRASLKYIDRTHEGCSNNHDVPGYLHRPTESISGFTRVGCLDATTHSPRTGIIRCVHEHRAVLQQIAPFPHIDGFPIRFDGCTKLQGVLGVC